MSSSSITEVRDSDERTPLLGSSSPEAPIVGSLNSVQEIVVLPAEATPTHSSNSKERLVSLDVFRGLTVALMILVDDAGKAFPSINHSPWFGVTLADFVMPFFLFVVGVSVSLVFKKVPSKPAATKKVLLRMVKLFILGVILQGGYFHGRGDLSYGVDIKKIRWMGVLQRISIGYLFSSILEIWLVNNISADSAMKFVRRYWLQALVAVSLSVLYMGLLYGLYVPDWEFKVDTASNSSVVPQYGSTTQTVHCNVRGSLDPPCNAVGFIDRLILGESHLYQRPVYKRTKECSINSPDYGPLPENAPGWCLAPFDPEGILSSLMAAITCLVGLHYGHILVQVKGHKQRIIFWSIFSFPLLIVGLVLVVVGIPLSKPLYTLSYMFTTAGASAIAFTIIYYIVDVICLRKPMIIFQWMGMNALIVYALAACDIFPAALQGLYWRSTENNLVDGSERLLQGMLHSEKWGTLTFVLLEILFWGIVAGFLHMKKLYIKL
ncbi:PREDICTED: heparan-alpha-glucosaminide N-acetyltransferase-like isoform X1 [Ipomoea nil]|uniref:heparan-alpha-glucosaminide N-acetyltransferase-like isoform X1 n=1 Tax=Ipomoea nil TaxID=35883 RepID=UPI000901ABE3|nr:PREDICTED: heparan-alpha-glucosaminide N-acetyltransferase-like isoform X1 [Ipomoea nil]XP_019163582.1 PREDICTED: heparan-alpha-glucosaminide N-acetyltransferase-like isoform X1 [Ipomoea nil]